MNPVHDRLLQQLRALGCQPWGGSAFVHDDVCVQVRTSPSGHRSFLETLLQLPATAANCREALIHNAVACPLVLGPEGFVRRITLQPAQWLHEPSALTSALAALCGGRRDATDGQAVLTLRPQLAADEALAAAIALWLLRNDHAALDGGFHSLNPHAMAQPPSAIWTVRIHGHGTAIAARRRHEAAMLRAFAARPDVARCLLNDHGAQPAPRCTQGAMPC